MPSSNLLKCFVDRPALYFGNREGYLREIEALAAGYMLGLRNCPGQTIDTPANLIPDSFIAMVNSSLPPGENGATGWTHRIRGQAPGERAEWELFKRLFEDYLRSASSNKPTRSNSS